MNFFSHQNGYGKIVLLNTDVYNDLVSHRDLRYKVFLPLQNPLPSVTQIIFNGRRICEGPPGKLFY